jgi:hypothetical protein
MHRHSDRPAMSQKIFSLDLDVETVSLYLLCCALADSGATISVAPLLEKWTGDRTSLENALQRLEARNILTKSGVSPEGGSEYRVMDERSWR